MSSDRVRVAAIGAVVALAVAVVVVSGGPRLGPSRPPFREAPTQLTGTGEPGGSPATAAGPSGPAGGTPGAAATPNAGTTGRPSPIATASRNFPPLAIHVHGTTCSDGTATLDFDVTAPAGAPDIRSIEVFLQAGTPAILNPQPRTPTRSYRGTATAPATSGNQAWDIQVFDAAGREFGMSNPDGCA